MSNQAPTLKRYTDEEKKEIIESNPDQYEELAKKYDKPIDDFLKTKSYLKNYEKTKKQRQEKPKKVKASTDKPKKDKEPEINIPEDLTTAQARAYKVYHEDFRNKGIIPTMKEWSSKLKMTPDGVRRLIGHMKKKSVTFQIINGTTHELEEAKGRNHGVSRYVKKTFTKTANEKPSAPAKEVSELVYNGVKARIEGNVNVTLSGNKIVIEIQK